MAEKETFIQQLHLFLESKDLTADQAKKYLEDIFIKAFEKDRDALSRYEDDEPMLANVVVDIDLTTGQVDIKRKKTVVKEKTILERFQQIEKDDELIKDLDLKIGDEFVEVIHIEDIGNGKRQHIKQLFLQKLSEIEKIKVYEKFSKFKGELLNAKVHRILTRGNVILDYDGDSIFMPANEIPHSDRNKIFVGNVITVYILEIQELSKDAQIIASRKAPNFVSKLIEREIDDVNDGVVKILEIAREAGIKTKVAVSSTLRDVDPVGSIIGVKGQRIKPIINELEGERIDIIKYHKDIKKFIVESLLPAEIIGIKINETKDGWREATVIVEEDQFLPALGKKGINIKLAAILTKSKIDVKTIAEAKEEGIEFEKVVKEHFQPQKTNNKYSENIDFNDIDSVSIENLALAKDSNFSESDYNFEESNKNNQQDLEEDNFDDEDYEKEYENK